MKFNSSLNELLLYPADVIHEDEYSYRIYLSSLISTLFFSLAHPVIMYYVFDNHDRENVLLLLSSGVQYTIAFFALVMLFAYSSDEFRNE